MNNNPENKSNDLVVTSNLSFLIDKPIDYQPCLIESLGEDALDYVLKAVKKGYGNRKIASELSDIYSTQVSSKDVQEVLDTNSKIMTEYMKYVDNSIMFRANLVLKESTVMVDDIERLDKVGQELEERMKQAITTKDLVAIGNTLSNLSRVRMDMVKNFKKLTGQYSEAPLINIDNSKTEITQNNIGKINEISDKLKKELSMANFNRKVINPEDSEIVVDD